MACARLTLLVGWGLAGQAYTVFWTTPPKNLQHRLSAVNKEAYGVPPEFASAYSVNFGQVITGTRRGSIHSEAIPQGKTKQKEQAHAHASFQRRNYL